MRWVGALTQRKLVLGNYLTHGGDIEEETFLFTLSRHFSQGSTILKLMLYQQSQVNEKQS